MGSETGETLVNMSDTLVLATILAYAVAIFCFALEAALGRQRALRTRELVTAGAADGIEVSLRVPQERPHVARHALGVAGVAVTVVGLLCNAGQILARGLAVQRWPWGNMFEFVVAICLCAVVAFLYLAIRHQARYLGVFVLIPVLVLLGIAVRWLYADAGPVVPALHSYWIAIHVTAAIIATGAFIVAGSATVTYIAADRAERRREAGGEVGSIAAKLPPSEVLDKLAHRLIVFAFPLWTFAIIAGAIWADEAWGRFWGWDPKEVWSFITWTVYAAYLHARATAGWRGTRSAWISLTGFACLMFNFFAVNYLFSGLHSYA